MSAGREIMNTVMQAATQQARNYAPDVCFGDVTSVDPLKVKLENGLELTEDFLVVSCLCKETVIKIPQDDQYEHVHDMDEFSFVKMGIGNMGAPIQWVPAGGNAPPATWINPDTNKEETNPEFTAWISSQAPTTTLDVSHKHPIHKALESIMLWRGLQKDDKVILIKFPPYKFLVLQRVEGITNDPEQ